MNHSKAIIGLVILIVSIIVSPRIYAMVRYFCKSNNIAISVFYQQLITAVISAIIPIIYAWITRIYKNWNRNIKACKRTLYKYCLKLSKSENAWWLLKKIATLIIHVFYYQKRAPLGQQQLIVNGILDELNLHPAMESNKRVFWIQGSPYSGKTTTVLNLFIDLISKKEYGDLFEQLDGKIIYIDLGRDDFKLSKLIDDYTIGRLENHFLVLDNLHKASSTECVSVIRQIVLDIHAYAIVILLRRPEDFLCGSERIMFLKTAMQSVGTIYNLQQISPLDFSVYKENAFNSFCSQFNLFDNAENTVIVHLLSLYARKNVDKWHLLDEIQAFIRGDDVSNEDHKKLMAIVAASLFTGSFNIQVLQICEDISVHSWKLFIQKLLDIGFLVNYPHSSHDYYYFHEALAKFYFEKNYVKPFYKSQYLDYFRRLLEYYLANHNMVLTYLYSVLQNEVSACNELFDQIVINANYINLYHELDFLLSQDEMNRPAHYRELGILCDRIGELREAKEYYIKYLKKSGSPDAFYKLLQIDHDYLPKYPHIVKEAKENADCYYRFLAKYWEAHVKMHDGVFDFEGFRNVVIEGQNQCEQILHNHPYDGIHLLRRLYFDCFRIYYLSGILNPPELKFLVDNSRLKQKLALELNEFDAYYIKFALGQFLAQDVLFSLAFLAKGISKNDYDVFLANNTSLEYEDIYDAEAIVKEAIVQYKNSIEKFKRIGDKTAIFVRYHMYNVKICLVDDGNFSECEQFYEDYMGFATRENDIEYQSYAELFKLKLLLVKISSPAIICNDPNYDDLIIQAKKKISITRKYQELCNTKNGNSYAELRLDLYETLFDFLIQNITCAEFKEKILSLRETALFLNYKREQHIINYIEKYKFNPGREQIRIIVTYYPIVTQ